MSKTQLIKAAKISTNAMAKLGKNEDVRVEVLIKICATLECKMDDILEIIPDIKWQLKIYKGNSMGCIRL